MKDSPFWKVVGFIAVLWLLLLLTAVAGNYGWHYYTMESTLWKVNKATGEVYLFVPAQHEWLCFNKR